MWNLVLLQPTVVSISVQTTCWFGISPEAINFSNFYPNSQVLCFNILQVLGYLSKNNIHIKCKKFIVDT